MSVKLMLMVAAVTSHCCVTACTCYSRCPLLSSVAEAMFVCQQEDPPDLVVVEVLEFIHRPPVTSLTPSLHVSSTNTKYRHTPSSIYEHINWHTEFAVSLLWATVYVYSRTDHISDMDRAFFFFFGTSNIQTGRYVLIVRTADKTRLYSWVFPHNIPLRYQVTE